GRSVERSAAGGTIHFDVDVRVVVGDRDLGPILIGRRSISRRVRRVGHDLCPVAEVTVDDDGTVGYRIGKGLQRLCVRPSAQTGQHGKNDYDGGDPRLPRLHCVLLVLVTFHLSQVVAATTTSSSKTASTYGGPTDPPGVA